MAIFDVSKKWSILVPASVPAARNAAEELALYISLLRDRAGFGKERPLIEDAETVAPPASVPVIILNAAAESRDRNGFTWRLGKSRVEIIGDSGRGLWNGVFDFLSALGFRWRKPGMEELPVPPAPGSYSLQNDRACHPSAASVQDRRRLVIGKQARSKEREQLIRWAARNKYDALIFSLREPFLWNRLRRHKGIYHTIERYALIVEAGGCDLSLLLSRRLFLLHRDMFRMDSGVRVRQRHFCPTNPGAITRIKDQAAKLFSRAIPAMTGTSGDSAAMPEPPVRVFHLWPDAGHEQTWCACPACRAFTPAEQNCIAVNSAADTLESIDSQAMLSYFKDSAADIPAGSGIAPRNNMFGLSPAAGTFTAGGYATTV
jgi:hypothetical protein